jgi:replicative DNA helicase
MSVSNNKLPPHNYEAEQSVLGSMLLDKRSVFAAVERLSAADFYAQKHQHIFEAMTELFNDDTPIDLVTLSEKLEKKNLLHGAEDIAYLSDLTQAVPSTANVSHYIKIVEEKSTLRRLIDTGNTVLKEAFDDDDKAENILNRAGNHIYEIALRNKRDSLKHVKSALLESYELLDRTVQSKSGYLGVPTGFGMLDRKLSGLQGSQLIVIAARPAMGKTSFAVDIVRYISLKMHIPSAIFSLEMSAPQIATRLMCSVGEVDMQRMRSGNLDDREYKKLLDAYKDIAAAPLFIDDTPGLTAMEMLAKARKLKMEKGLGVIMIDYLQLLSSSSRTENRQLEISEMTRSLKIAARELDVPILVLSQLSRASEKREGKIPMLSDLRESGSIEQDADVVVFLHRENYYDKNIDDDTTNVIIAKQRMGPTGIINLKWDGAHTRFLELDEVHEI